MSRDIKYRAWLKSVGEMVEVLEIDLYNKEVAYIWTEQTFDYVLEQTREVDKIDDLVLMQYTNLKDKNGVEIYEGDIVSMIIFEDNAEYLGDVVFKNGCFCLNISLNGTKYKIPTLEWKETETIITVIGSIYENPTLLEVSP